MARIEAMMKGGFYPLSPEWGQMVIDLFQPSSNSFRFLDPFAGEGDFALQFCKALNGEAYLVENDESRARKCQEKVGVNNALWSDSYMVRMSNEAFPVLWLNPPFDTYPDEPDRRIMLAGENRSEFQALSHFQRYLQDGGYLLWTAYVQHMSYRVFQKFFQRCSFVHIYRFPGKHLDNYTQVLIVGQLKKGAKVHDDNWIDENYPRFKALRDNPEKIQLISAKTSYKDGYTTAKVRSKVSPEPFYVIPANAPVRGGSHIEFVPEQLDDKVLCEINAKWGPHNNPEFKELSVLKPAADIPAPIHNPREFQIPVIMHGGMFDEMLLEVNETDSEGKKTGNKKPVLIRGVVRRQTVKVAEKTLPPDSHGHSITDTTMANMPFSMISVIDEKGEVKVFDEDETMDFISENREALMKYYFDKYKPSYDMTIHPAIRKLLDQVRIVHKHSLWPMQKYVITALAEEMAASGSVLPVGEPGVGKTAIHVSISLVLRLIHVAKGAWLAKRKGQVFKSSFAEYWKISNDEMVSLIDSIIKRYDIRKAGKHDRLLSHIYGLRTDRPVLIACPATLPEQWVAEFKGIYPHVIIKTLITASDAHDFLDEALSSQDDRTLYVAVVSYERAKLASGWVAAYNLKRGTKSYHVYQEYNDDTGEYEKVIRHIPTVICPTTGGEIVEKVGSGRYVDVTEEAMNGKSRRKRFYIGEVFDGYRVERDALNPTRTKLVAVNKTFRTKNGSDTTLTSEANGFAAWQQSRMKGDIPKLGNGRVTLIKEPVRVTRGSKTREILVTRAGENLIPERPILDRWLATKGIYPSSTNKIRELTAALKKRKLKSYTYGTGNAELDTLLAKHDIDEYSADDGERRFKNPRWPIASYLKRYVNRVVNVKGKPVYIDHPIGFLVADEIHVARAKSSDVGIAMRELTDCAARYSGTTGTIYGGFASSIYSILFKIDDSIRRDFPWTREAGAISTWVHTMGATKTVFRTSPEYKNGSYSGHKRYVKGAEQEAAGFSPLLTIRTLEHAAFFGLSDAGSVMREFEEIPIEIPMDEMLSALYESVYDRLRQYNAGLVASGDGTFTASMYSNLLRMVDSTFRSNEVWHRRLVNKHTGERQEKLVMTIPSLGEGLRSKEKKLIELINHHLDAGDRIIVAVAQTDTRDIQPRIQDIILKNCPKAKPFILGTVDTGKRIGYITKRVLDEGKNVMITNPRKVAVGANLTMFNVTICMEILSELQIMAQFTRRCHRPRQPRPYVKVYYLYYDDVYQNQAVAQLADKIAASDALVGNRRDSLAKKSLIVADYEGMASALDVSGFMSAKKVSLEDMKAKFGKQAQINFSDLQRSPWYVPEEYKNEQDEDEVVIEFDDEEVVEDLSEAVESEPEDGVIW